jgi:hypothetical protein
LPLAKHRPENKPSVQRLAAGRDHMVQTVAGDRLSAEHHAPDRDLPAKDDHAVRDRDLSPGFGRTICYRIKAWLKVKTRRRN